ncbi:MAG: acetyl-CoA C-acyltransferase [Candidatus Wallbacteria bacterium]|nr:acetyl-CoA C-acyltransferase [Candidatus Wallbacteria bacterium]
MKSPSDLDPVIVDAVRTPIGRIRGVLKDVRADDLAAVALAAVVKRTGVGPETIDDVLLGCANQAGEDNRNVARMALLLAGLPQSVPGVTLNRLCGSGLEAVWTAARSIRSGEGELFLAGGVESMTRAPLAMMKGAEPFAGGPATLFDTSLGWRFPNPRMEKLFPLEGMGETAENLAERFGLSRREQDAFALASHQKAVAAQDEGCFASELVPVEIPQRRGPSVVVTADEGPRRDTTLERLAELKPAFRPGGTVTAGNSSSLNDGAAALVVCSRRRARDMGLRPIARILGAAAAGVDPRYMGIGPVPAARTALARAGVTTGKLDLIELNEAFAAVGLACIRELALDEARVNVHGGAIALGHPLGCSGARILTTLVHAMRRRSARLGLAAMCIGVGQGIAMVVEGEGGS